MSIDLSLYEKLTSLSGVSGNEGEIKKFVKSNLVGASEIIEDGLGGVFGVYPGSNGPKIMICAHMDEIGLMITKIQDNGFLQIMPIGGINPESFVSQNVYVIVGDKKIKGVISSIPPHISKDNNISFEDLILDIGCDSAKEVLDLGIRIGTYASPIDNFYLTENKKYIVNKAFDDRLGVAVVLDVVKELGNIKHPNTLYLGGTVQEEVGLRGATVSSNMIKPDLFITIDVSPIGDYLGKSDEGKLGEGFLIRYFDPGCIMPIKLKEYFVKVASENNLSYQYFKSKGRTDAGVAQFAGNGILATTVGIPGRYIHSPATMASIKDLETVKSFVLALIKSFDDKTLKELHE